MKQFVTLEEKFATVKTFAANYGIKLNAKRYVSVKKILDNKLLTPLYDLPRDEQIGHTDKLGNTTYRRTEKYAEADVRDYVRWLVAVVTGGIQETDEVVNKAFDQLYTAIIALKNDGQFIGQDFELLPSYNFFNALTDLRAKVDRMDSQIVYTLEKIQNWQKTYQPCLDDLKRRYDQDQEMFKHATGGKK